MGLHDNGDVPQARLAGASPKAMGWAEHFFKLPSGSPGAGSSQAFSACSEGLVFAHILYFLCVCLGVAAFASVVAAERRLRVLPRRKGVTCGLRRSVQQVGRRLRWNATHESEFWDSGQKANDVKNAHS